MSDISKLDINFAVNTNIEKDDIKFYDVDDSPFKVYGIFRENGKYRRMPETIAKNVSEGVYGLHSNTAGGRVRFVTDSSYVAIYAEMENLCKMAHFPFAGSIGFDMYEKTDDGDVYIHTFMPSVDIVDGYESLKELGDKKMRELTINFPLYSDVKHLYIGLEDGSTLDAAPEYKITKPVVYYGSSITQGGCASRPGNAYEAILTRRFDCDHINLGFSGSARAEDVMIDYLKNLDMSIFVLDYDHNAPTPDHLRNTHEKLFKAVRECHPELPVIMMTRPKYYLTPEEEERRTIVETTYNNAINAGDKNVYFIDGKMLTGEDIRESGTVDNCHPTDLGFFAMARAVSDVMAKILN